jgi:type I restriction enzyme S subunit
VSFAAYDVYRETGIAFVPAIPATWTIAPVRRVLKHIEQGWSPECFSRPASEGEWGVLKAGCVNRGVFVAAENKALPAALTALPEYEVRPGDVLVSRASGSPELVGSTALVKEVRPKLMLSDKIFRVHIDEQCVDKAFFALLMSSSAVRAQIVRSLSGADGLANNLPQSDFRSLLLPLPSLDEQRTIAAFLERETGMIDALVTEQEHLIELLNEKRQAVVTHAATKGLNPQIPMKHSGVPWLGSIPAHWGVLQSRRLFAVRNEPALPNDVMLTASQKYGVLPQAEFVEREGRRVVEVIKGVEQLRHVEPNDFIISMRSFQGGLEWSKLRGSTSFHYVMVVPRDLQRIYPPFFAHLFKSSTYIQALRSTTDLIRDGQEIRYSHFVQVPLPVVPLDEQKAIADFLDRQLVGLDGLAAEAERAIALLKERRTALITAAVTGQIDVRPESMKSATGQAA